MNKKGLLIAMASMLMLMPARADIVTVNNPAGADIYETLESNGWDYRTIDSLKVTGSVSDYDFQLFSNSMQQLVWLDLTGTNISSVPNKAFEQCNHLQYIALPTSVTSIGDRAFVENYNLQQVVGSENVRIFGEQAFSNCSQLQSIQFGDNVEDIKNSAFWSCCQLNMQLAFNENLKSLGDGSFYNCNITSVDLSKTRLSNIYCNTFGENYSLTSVSLPEINRCRIDCNVFYNAPITSIIIPENIDYLGDYAFHSCSLTSIVVNNSTPIEICNNTFDNVDKQACTLFVPVGSKKEYIRAKGWAAFYNIVEAGYSISTKGEGSIQYHQKDYSNGSMVFPIDGDLTLDFVPAPGYEVESVSFNGAAVTLTNGSYTVDSNTLTGKFVVNFLPKSLELTVSYTGEGQIVYDGTIISSNDIIDVNGGQNVNFYIVPAEGNVVKSLKFNGTEYYFTSTTFATPVLSDNSSLTVEFVSSSELDSWNDITISQIGKGEVLFNGVVVDNTKSYKVQPGSTVQLQFVADRYYSVSSVIVQGEERISDAQDGIIVLNDVSTDLTVEVNFSSSSAIDIRLSEKNTLSTVLIDGGYDLLSIVSLTLSGDVGTRDLATVAARFTSLETLDLSGTDISSIPEGLFQNNNTIRTVILPASVTSISNNAFYQCQSLESVLGCENVTVIGESAFNNCTKLKTQPFGNKLIETNYYSFFRCESLVSITLPASLKRLRHESFVYCNNLEQVDMSACSNIEMWEGYVFYSCGKLKQVLFPEYGNYSIGGCTFENSGIEEIYLTGKISEINECVFRNTPLKTIHVFQSTPFTIRSNSFENVDKSECILYVPASSKDSYENAVNWSSFINIKEFGFTVNSQGQGSILFNDKEVMNGTMSASENGQAVYSFIPAPGFYIRNVTFNGQVVELDNGKYSIDSSKETGKIEVVFAPESLSLQVFSSGNGSVYYENGLLSSGTFIDVDGGQQVTVKIQPNDNCFVKSVKYNGVESAILIGEDEFTTAVITEPSTLEVEFGSSAERSDYVKVSVQTNGFGTINYNGVELKSGNSFLVRKAAVSNLTVTNDGTTSISSILLNSNEILSELIGNVLPLSNLSTDVVLDVTFYSQNDAQIDNPSGKLKTLIENQGYNIRRIKRLKLTGNIGDADWSTMSAMPMLKELDLSETTITMVPDYAFQGNGQLESVSFPLTLTTVGSYAFDNCNSLKQVTGIENIRFLYQYSFSYCSSLTQFPYGAKIETIDNCAFENSNMLPKDVVLPASLRHLGGFVFNYDGINSIDLSACSITDGFSWYAFGNGAKSVMLPEYGSYNIGFRSFDGTGVSSLVIPAAAISLCGDHIFENASNLHDIYMKSCIPPTTSDGPFDGFNVSAVTLHVPTGSKEEYEYARDWNLFGNIVEYGITISATDNGVVYVDGKKNVDGSAIIPNGNDINIKLIPNAGYEIGSVNFNNQAIAVNSDGTFVLDQAKQEGVLDIRWVLKKFDIALSVTGEGKIVYEGKEYSDGQTLRVDSASVSQFSLIPAEGSLVKSVSFNGQESIVQNGGKTFVTPEIYGHSNFNVEFAQSSGLDGVCEFEITTGAHGKVLFKNTTMLPETSINLEIGSTAVFELISDRNYHVSQVLLNGNSIMNNYNEGLLTVSNIAAGSKLVVNYLVDKEVFFNAENSGTLSTQLFTELKDSLESLVVAGPLYEGDLDVIKYELPKLQHLDIADAYIDYLSSCRFGDMKKLVSVVLPKTLTGCSGDIFTACSSLESITLPEGSNFDFSTLYFADGIDCSQIVIHVPEGTENNFRNRDPWTRFAEITDGKLNAVGDMFTVDGIKYQVVDIDNHKVASYINRMVDYDRMQSTVSYENIEFSVVQAFVSGFHPRDYYTIQDGGRWGGIPWPGKYLYARSRSANNTSDWNVVPGSEWMMDVFDDSNWTSFDGPIANDGGNTDWKGEYDCYWTRQHFIINSLSDYEGMLVRLNMEVDDVADVYINGKLVHSGYGSSEYLTMDYFREGDNLLAVHCVNYSGVGCFTASLGITGFERDGVYYSYYGNNLQVVGVSDTISSVVIPGTINLLGETLSVVRTDDYAFRNNSRLKYISLPEDIKIGYRSFENCIGLKTLKVASEYPVSVNNGGLDAFNRAVVELIVPEGCEEYYRISTYWNEFAKITDNITNSVGDKFEENGITYIVTDIENRTVTALIEFADEYDMIPQTVQSDGYEYSISDVKLLGMRDDGTIMFVDDGRNSLWTGRYIYSSDMNASAPSGNWMSIDYNDSQWTEFTGPLAREGYYAGTNWNGEYDTYWVRRVITLPENVDRKTITVLLEVDDEIVLYLNGEKIFENSGQGSINTSFNLPSGLIRQGDNILAAQVKNSSGGAAYMYVGLCSPLLTDADIMYQIIDMNNKLVSVSGLSMSKSTVVIPSEISFLGKKYSVVGIDRYAFLNDTILKSLVIPSTVNRIDYTAFAGCSSLESMTLQSGNSDVNPDGWFDNLNVGRIVLNVPEGTENNFRNRSPWNGFAEVTDGIINCNGDKFDYSGKTYTITDIDNRLVSTSVSTLGEYDYVLSTIVYEGSQFTVSGISLNGNRGDGSFTLLDNGCTESWTGKYWYSSEKSGDIWSGRPSDSWMNPDFDDSRWTSFTGPIANDGCYGNTEWKGNNDCYWIRREFEVKGNPDAQNIAAEMSFNDNIVMYINGKKVYEGMATTFTLPADVLVEGRNVLAVQATNYSGSNHLHIGLAGRGVIDNGIRYDFYNYEDKTLRVTGVTTPVGSLVIPSTVSYLGQQCPVVEIGSQAFNNDTILKSLVIPSTVNRIDYTAFAGCSSLESMTLQSGNADVNGWGWFENLNTGRIVLNVPEGTENNFRYRSPWDTFAMVTDNIPNEVGDGIYLNGIKYTIVDFANRTVAVSGWTDAMPSVVIPSEIPLQDNVFSVVGIDRYAFLNDTILKSLVIPSTVNRIDYTAFAGCSSLESMTLQSGNADVNEWGWFENLNTGRIVLNVPEGTENNFRNRSPWNGFAEVTDGIVNSIGERIVYGGYTYTLIDAEHRNLEVTIEKAAEYESLPKTITDNGYVYNVTDIRLLGMRDDGSMLLVDDGRNTPWTGKYYYSSDMYAAGPDNWMTVGFDDSGWNEFTGPVASEGYGLIWRGESDTYWTRRKVTLPDDFEDQPVKASIEMDDEIVLYINGEKVYEGGSADVVIRSGLMKKGENLIAAQGKNTGGPAYMFVSLYTSGLNIDGIQYEFYDRYSHTVAVAGHKQGERSIDIPSEISFLGISYKVARIKEQAFRNDSTITTVSGMRNVKSIGYRAFYNCTALTSFEFGDSLSSIDSEAFANCPLLSGTVSLPLTLTYIGAYAFNNCRSISGVTVPGNVSRIEYGAFFGCSMLSSVVIENGVSSIGDNAFDNTAISELYIPSSVSSIGWGAFENSQSLKKVVFEDGLAVLESNTFYNCTNLKDVTLPGTLTRIGSGVFQSCRSLTGISLPGRLQNICDWAFYDCDNLTDITIPASVSSIDSYAFYNCDGLSKVHFNNGLLSIGNNAFESCGIDSITLPSSLASIGDNAFANCYKLEYVALEEGIRQIGYGLFREDRNLTTVELPNTLTSILPDAFVNCSSLSSLRIPASVTSIGENALRNIPVVFMKSAVPPALSSENQFEAMTAIVLPSGTYDTYCNAAYWSQYKSQFTTEDFLDVTAYVSQNPNNSNLLSVLGEENLGLIVGLKIVGTINSHDIKIIRNKMILLRTLDLSEASIVANNEPYYYEYHTDDNVIGSNMFCELNISRIVLPDNIVAINSSAFERCQYLTEIVIPGSVESVGYNAFSSCSLLSSVIIEDGVKNIGSGAFAYCWSLRAVTIGNGVRTIESDAFRDCSSLRSVRFGDKVEEIGGNAFANCGSLVDVQFGRSLKRIYWGAFENCGSLTDIILPVGLETIESSAFWYCSQLKQIKIPSSVKSIGESAFYGCQLEKVYTYTIEPTEINQKTFGADRIENSAFRKATLYVPATSYYNYYNHTQWGQFPKLEEFNEPYEYFYLNNDLTMSETTVRIDGDPDMEMNSTSGIVIEGSTAQVVDNIDLVHDGVNGASIIAGDGNNANLVANSMTVSINVEGNRWYFFCFPFSIPSDSIECTEDYVFYEYDGRQRASGNTGWKMLDMSAQELEEGIGYIFQCSNTGILKIHVPSEYLSFKSENKSETLNTYSSSRAEDASWNLIGNPFISYYDIEDLAEEYDKPIIVWDGYNYQVYRPGDDDDYQLKPFEACFVQKGEDTPEIMFLAENKMTQGSAANRSLMRSAMRSPMRGSERGAGESSRQLVNILLLDNEGRSDRTRIVFNNEASREYEIGVDASKFISDGIHQLYSVVGDVRYAINERPFDYDDIHLGYIAPVSGTYTLEFPRVDAEIRIYDCVAERRIDLSAGSYTFTTEAGTFNDRFVVNYAGTTGIDRISMSDGTVLNVSAGRIDIVTDGEVSVFDASGKLIAVQSGSGSVILPSGLYIVKSGEQNEKITVK